MGAAVLLHLWVLDVGHDHLDGYLRGDQYRHVLLPAVLGGLPLVRCTADIDDDSNMID